jgi:hypothetical protein
MRSNLVRNVPATIAIAFVAATVAVAQQSGSPRFLSDDPLTVDDDRRVDAGRAARDVIGGWADFLINTFFPAADLEIRRAANVNTLDEVPNSSWFTNRTGTMRLEDIVRGPDRVARLNVRRWVIIAGKDSGRQPGFRAIDAADPTRHVFQIEFDPRGNPELATGAEIIGTAIYHALGYNVVDVYLTDIDADALSIAPDATISVDGKRRRFTRHDLAVLLRNVARKADGRYRALASRFAEGRNVGPFRYYGTRPDDPNDIYDHEHRRELRGNRVFAAWLNHDDSRAINTLDMLEGPPGRQSIRHYMFDFGSILGSGTDGNDHAWVGHESVIDGPPAWKTLFSLGVYRRPYLSVQAPGDMPAAGNFTADGFVPATWRPHYPNPAFLNMQPDDAFWAARKLAALSPDAIAAVVQKAEYSDARVADYVAGTLIRRRELVLRTWLTGFNPVVDARVTGDRLELTNAAVAAGVATPEARYELSWFVFDNVQNRHRFVGVNDSVTVPPDSARGVVSAAFPGVLKGNEYVGVEIRTMHQSFPSWSRPVRMYLRRAADGWATVGLDRTVSDGASRVANR